MITAFRRPLSREVFGLCALVACVINVSCDRVALMAPSGSTIVLTTDAQTLPLSGKTRIVAQVIEPAGTPPNKGTLVSFTTSLGTIVPAEAETDSGGRVAVAFIAGTLSGTATIMAVSGGVTTGTAGAAKIAVGAAAVGRIVVGAYPTIVSSQGGVSTITASVADTSGNALELVPVTFTTTAGTLASSSVLTDASGTASTTLNTSVEATVTATAGINGTAAPVTPTPGATPTPGGSTSTQVSGTVTIKVATTPTITITPPTGTLTAGSPLSFGLTITPPAGGTTTIREVRIDFGDGTDLSLGAIQGSTTVQHAYGNTEVRNFTIRVTVTDSLGFTTSAATVIVVQPQPPLSVSVSKSATPSGANTQYTLTATVFPTSTTVVTYRWLDGTTELQNTSSNTLVRSVPTGEVHTITVIATTTTAQTASTTVGLP
jgi:adhesin/invasin